MINYYHFLTADDKTNLGTVIGTIIGILVVFALILVWVYCRHKLTGIIQTKENPLPVVHYNNSQSVNTA